MKIKRIVHIFAFSICGSMITIISFVVTMNGKIFVEYLLVPAIPQLTFIFIGIMGIILFTYLLFMFKNMRLSPLIPVLYGMAIIVPASLNLLFFHQLLAIYGSMLYWMVAPIVIRLLANRILKNLVIDDTHA